MSTPLPGGLPTPDGAAKVFVYGYPLVYDLDEVAGFVAGGGALPVSGPYNRFVAARDLLGPETHFVSPNNDTLYLMAMCDVRGGPLRLEVPDTDGRYYVLQFIDAWTNNFAYVGRRATGTGAGTFVLAAAGWAGELPDDATLITAPTGIFTIAGRVQVDGASDLAAVHALQDRFVLEPFEGAAGTAPAGVPPVDPAVGEELVWWEKFRTRLAAFPPPPDDAPFVDAAAELGLLTDPSPYVDPPAELRDLLVDAEAKGRELIEALASGGSRPKGEWQAATHYFDYNLDFFEIGAVDDPAWKIPDRTTAYATRAVAARAGLWGNNGYEADYRLTAVDADGQPLTGEHAYALHLDVPPPVDAFWSLTMYASPDYYLVDNPIDRYSIGDRTEGLVTDGDGSITIWMQATAPGGGRDANWLPTPPGPFRPILRLYQPRPEVLDGRWSLPPIQRLPETDGQG